MDTPPTFVQRFTSIDRKFPWSFLGFLFGGLFFLASLYLTIFYTKQPRFRFEIVSEGPVYDIKENLSKLEVLFDGEDIRKNQQELSFISIRVTNDGNSDLPKGAYDEDALPRFMIPNSRIITIEPLAASSRYLKEHSKIFPVIWISGRCC